MRQLQSRALPELMPTTDPPPAVPLAADTLLTLVLTPFRAADVVVVLVLAAGVAAAVVVVVVVVAVADGGVNFLFALLPLASFLLSSLRRSESRTP